MLCVPGDLHRPLYLVHTGAVAVLDAVPEEGSKEHPTVGGVQQGAATSKLQVDIHHYITIDTCRYHSYRPRAF